MSSTAHALIVCADAHGVAREAAEQLRGVAEAAIAERGAFYLAIPGGSSPKVLFELLTQPGYRGLPWENTHIFFTDERCVGPQHPDSNYRLASELLISRVAIPGGNVHRFHAELPPDEAAKMYESEMRRVMGNAPRLDLAILGMGDDTHTASLFPHSPALDERVRLATADWVEKLDTYRLTLTIPMLNGSRNVIVLATGSGKAAALAEALNGEVDVAAHPIQAIKPGDGRLVWIVDREAASLL